MGLIAWCPTETGLAFNARDKGNQSPCWRASSNDAGVASNSGLRERWSDADQRVPERKSGQRA
jgi:hypothetical protein